MSAEQIDLTSLKAKHTHVICGARSVYNPEDSGEIKNLGSECQNCIFLETDQCERLELSDVEQYGEIKIPVVVFKSNTNPIPVKIN